MVKYKTMLKKLVIVVAGIFLGAGFTVSAAQITVPSASSAGQLLTSLSTGNWQASTSPTLWGTFTAKNFVATSTTADSVFPRLSVTNSTTTNATSTSFFSSVLSSSLARITSLFLPSLATPAGTLIAVDNNGQVIATTTPTGGGTPGGADTYVQFNDGGTFGGEAGFYYLKSPTSQLFVPEVRSSTYSDPTGVTSLNLGGTDVTLNSNGGLFRLNNGTAMLRLDTLGLTAPRTATFQDKDGTVAYLSDIGGSGASTTLYSDNGTFTGSNIFTNASTTITNLNTVFSTTTTRLAVGVVPSNTNNGPFMNGTGFGNFTSSCNNCGASGGNLLSVAAFGAGVNGQAGVNTFSANGTAAAPSASQLNDNLYFMGGRGFGATVWNVGSKAAIGMKAAENFTDTANGTYMTFEVTPKLSTTRAEAMRIDSTGFIGIGTSSPYARLSVVGETVSANFTATSTTATSTLPNLAVTQAKIGTLNGIIKGMSGFLTTATAGTDYENPLTFVAPLFRSGNSISWFGLSTTSQPASSNLLVSNGSNGVFGVATTTASCSGSASCSAFTVIGSSPVTITASAGSGSGLGTTTASWIIYLKGSNVVAYDTMLNSERFTGSSFNSVFSSIVGAATTTPRSLTAPGFSVYLKEGIYSVTGTSTIEGGATEFSPQWVIRGSGASTTFAMNANTSLFNVKNQGTWIAGDFSIAFHSNFPNAIGIWASNTAPFSSKVQSSMRESHLSNIKFFSTTSPNVGTAMVLDSDFRNYFDHMEIKYLAQGILQRNYYTTAQFISGDDHFTRMFCEVDSGAPGVCYDAYGNVGQINQVTIDDVNGISNDTVTFNDIFFRGRNIASFHTTNANIENFATTSQYLQGSFDNTFMSNKYIVPYGSASKYAALFEVDSTSYNNTFSCARVDTLAGSNVWVVYDKNSVSNYGYSLPNVFQGVDGGGCRIQGAATEIYFNATSSTIIRDVIDDVNGTNNLYDNVKVDGNRLILNFKQATAAAYSFLQNSSNGIAFFISNAQKAVLNATGFGIASTTPGTSLAIGTGATNYINISESGTSTFYKGINVVTGCLAVGGTCITSGAGSGASSTLLGDNNLFTGANIFNNITRSTTTGATTTNLFSTTASSTNLYTTNFFAGGLNTCNAANQALTYTNGLFGCNSAITAASSTLLANNNTFSGANSFATMLVTGSSTFQNLTALKATTTAATTTDLTVTDAPIFTALSGLLKGNGSSPLTAAVNGTDFTLITAKTCTAGDFVSAVTAAGVFTCSTPSGGGGGGGSGIGWTWNNVNSLYMSTSTDDLLLGATATSSNAKVEAIDNGLVAWFATTTGATIRPIFTAFRDLTTGVSGIGVNASTTEDSLTVNGRSNFDPMLAGCDLIGIGGNVTTDQLAGQLCDWLAFDINTDGRITQTSVDFGAGESGMPIFTRMEAGIATSLAQNELAMFKTQRAISATTTMTAEQLIRLPSTHLGTSTRAYIFGFGGEAQGSLTTSAAYLTPTNACHFVASSTNNFQAVSIRAGTQTITDTGIATSTLRTTFRRFRVQQNYTDGCQYMVNGTVVVTHAAANVPTGPMVAHWGVLSTVAAGGSGTASLSQYDFAEPKVWWGRWQPK